MAGSRPVQARARKVASSRSRRNAMRSTLRLIALATGAIQPSSGKLGTRLPASLEEDVRLIGALAELFAAAAAQRLMDTGVAMDATQPTLPLIALATGAALCAPLLEPQAIPRPGGKQPRSLGRSSARSRVSERIVKDVDRNARYVEAHDTSEG